MHAPDQPVDTPIAVEVRQCKKPGMAVGRADYALRRYMEGGSQDKLHEALLYLARCCQLLAQGQKALKDEVVELNHRLPDLDTPSDPVAPSAPGIEPKTSESTSTAKKLALAAQAQKQLKPGGVDSSPIKRGFEQSVEIERTGP